MCGLAPFGVTGFGKLSEKFVRRARRKGVRALVVCSQTAPRVSPRKGSVDSPFAEAFGTVHWKLRPPEPPRRVGPDSARPRCARSARRPTSRKVSKDFRAGRHASSAQSLGVAFGLRSLAWRAGLIRHADEARPCSRLARGRPAKNISNRKEVGPRRRARSESLSKKILRPCLLGRRVQGRLKLL